MTIFQRLYKTWLLYILFWIGFLTVLEILRIRWSPEQMINFLSLAIPAMTALIALVVAIAASRLEGYKEDSNKAGSVKEDFSKFGTRIMVAIGVFIIVASIGTSNTAWVLSSEVKLHFDTLIMSAMTALVVYGISGAISYFKNW